MGSRYVVEALCGFSTARDWLLRRSCDGHFLNGYFAGKVATAAHLHEAITTESDDDLVDHTTDLLTVTAYCGGMGTTLEDYPLAHAVLEAHVGHFERQRPALARHRRAAYLIDNLAELKAIAGVTAEHEARLLDRYRAVLERAEWREVLTTPEEG